MGEGAASGRPAKESTSTSKSPTQGRNFVFRFGTFAQTERFVFVKFRR